MFISFACCSIESPSKGFFSFNHYHRRDFFFSAISSTHPADKRTTHLKHIKLVCLFVFCFFFTIPELWITTKIDEKLIFLTKSEKEAEVRDRERERTQNIKEKRIFISVCVCINSLLWWKWSASMEEVGGSGRGKRWGWREGGREEFQTICKK